MSQTSTFAASLEDVFEAAKIIEPFAHRTQIVTCETLDKMAGRKLFFKCENFQKIGAFKFRGACNAVMRLTDEQAAKGVVTHSSGNHAQALALAARMRNIPAHIVMPSTASPIKKAAVIDYGGNVIECQPNLESRETTAAKVQSETGATLIPPYDHPDIIAGQGTATLELLQDQPDLDVIVAPVGGGGLIGGCCAVAKDWKNPIRVIAAEPSGADDAFRSKAANQLLLSESPNTISDGLLTSLGDLTWPFVRDVVEQVILVTEEEIIHTMRLFWERTKVIIEPSSAVAVAVGMSSQFQADRVGVIISGGNVNFDDLPW